MNSDHSLRTLFSEALEVRDPVERAAWLEDACVGDEELRWRVELLLRAHDEAGRFLSQPSKPPTDLPGIGPGVLPPSEQPGDWIGRYKLLEQIGEGGCGVVYMAEQEEPVRRRVALKVIKLGMDTRQVMARFEAERQALAMMDHPNIARVLDAGATDSGRPFFVMELVRGIRITDFCDARKLSARERLALFLPVCQAVQHAHQKGIIHRDLKPANILVTMIDGVAVPKVIDFGIAKATNNQRLTDMTLFTAFEQFIGTPAYMSPEQAEMSGGDIDTRTDIYSLGVVLYELLTGKTPFDGGEMMKAGLDAVRRTIRETEPPKPSTRLHDLNNVDLTSTAAARHTEAPRLIHQIRGDLDWIAMKCLEKDRNRRYETTTGLAMDVQRHLNNEAVTARPPSAVYQTGRFLRRRRGLALGAAAVLAAMLVGTVASTWQAVRATRAERSAETELRAKQKALREAVTSRGEAMEQRERVRRAVDEMYTEFSEKLLARTPRMEPMQQAFLEKALDYYEVFAGEGHADPVALRKTAEASRRVGEIREKLGDLPQAEAAYRRSIELLEAGERSHPPADEADLAALAGSLQVLASLQSITSQAADAEANVRRALALRETLALAPLPPADSTHQLARTLNLLGIILSEKGAVAEALETCQRSLRELDSALPAEASAEEKQATAFTRISTLTNLADLSKDLGQAEKTEQHLREARELAGRLVDEEPGNPGFRVAQRVTYNNSAAFSLARSDFQTAETFFGKAEAIARKLAEDFPLVPDHRMAEMSSRANVALVLSLQHRNEEAAGMLRESFAGFEALSSQFPENLDYAAALADEHLNLGTVLKDLGRFAEARHLYEKSLEINQTIHARLPSQAYVLQGLSKTWFNLGLLHHAVEESDQAYAAFEEAIRTIESLPDASDSLDAAGSIASSLVQQSMILRGSRQRPDLSLPLLERSESLIGRCLANNPLSQDSRTTSTTLKRELGDVFLALDRPEEAVAAFEDSIAQCRALVADFPGKVEYMNRLGDSLCGLSHVWEEDPEKTEKSIELVREALALQEVILEQGVGGRTTDIARRSLAHHCDTLALLLMDKGLTEDAQAMQQRGHDMQKRIIATDPARKEPWCALGAGLNNFAIRLRDADQPDKAIALLRQAVEAQQEAIKIDPSYERSRWFLRNHFMNIAQAQWMLNDLQAAIVSYSDAVRVGEDLVRDRPSAPFHQNNLAVDLNALATLEQDAGRIAESLVHQERMLELVERLSASEDENLPDRSVLADLQQALARLYALGPDPELRNASRAVELARAATANDPSHPTAWHALGLAHCMTGTPAEAIAAVEESIKLTGAGDALNWFVRAMARWQLGDQEGARQDQSLALTWLKGEGSKPFRKMAEPYEAEATKTLKLRPGAPLPDESSPPSDP